MSRRPPVPLRRRLAAYATLIATCALASAIAPAPAATRTPPAPPVSGDWPMAAHDYASTRFSPLAQIDATNVANLQVAFTFSTGVDRGQEAAPIVVGGTMYLATPWPNVLYALDLTRPGAPVKWKYEPRPEAAAQGVACCDVVTRGAAFWRDEVIFNTLDGNTIALDAATGKERWKTRLAHIQKGETITMAPLVVKGRVLVGNAGGEFGVRGWLAALDAATGELAWKVYNTGPDKDVGIGPDFHPFYAGERGKDLGVSSWPPDAWKIGGGTVWGWISYDPKLDLIFHGTGNPGPWNAAQRPGDNKWTAGLFARDPDTGAARWFQGFAPHDLFDYDAVNESLLLDFPGHRPVIVRPERNGFIYVLDRRTGQVLSADPFTAVNAIERIDLKTGRPVYNPDKQPRDGRTTRMVCPASPGAKDWNPSAFSHRTGLVYIPHINLCMDWLSAEVNYIAGTPYVGADARMYAAPGHSRGELLAWDPVHRRKAWSIDEDLPLWKFQTGSGIIGQPVSYRGPDGRQYVAVLSGVGGWAGAIVVGKFDMRDTTSGGGLANAVRDLPAKTQPGGTLYVFALPEH